MINTDRLPPCPLCHHAHCPAFASVDGRDYFRCPHCELTFLAAALRPDAASERRHYDLHENDPHDPRYRRWLARLAEPLGARLAAPARGLDFGCGPGPALAMMLRERGHHMALYDPIYAADPQVLDTTYDFITCTEVVEHFHRPDAMFTLLAQLLAPGGWLGIMTAELHDSIEFSRWHYRRDPTHVCFYRPRTFAVIGALNGMTPVPVTDTGVMLLQKQAG